MRRSKKHIRYIVMSAIYISLITVTFNIGISNNPNFSIYDLGLNLASELLALIFTILVVDTYIKAKSDFYQERAQRKNSAQQEAIAPEIADGFAILQGEGANVVKSVSTVRDEQTGIRYLLVVHTNGSALTPLLDQDGTQKEDER